tara:strand:- start:2042 stop:2629 length:588 start_codon:yes stop_codon:yes gene_type:complete
MKLENLILEMLLINPKHSVIFRGETWRRPALIGFGGTQSLKDLIVDDLDIRPTTWPPQNKHKIMVHGGFAQRTMRLIHEIEDFIESENNFALGGHSLGGACAILCASYLSHEGKNVKNVFTFGTPFVGTTKFQKYYKHQNLWNLTENYVTPRDPVVKKIPYIYKPVGNINDVFFEDDDIWKHHDLSTYSQVVQHN